MMALPCTASAADGVRAVTNVTLLSTTSSTAPCLQPICLPGWNQLVSPAPMASALMESPWYPGGVVGSLCGTPPARTLLPPPTYQVPPERQVQWQPWLSGASRRSTQPSINATTSHRCMAIETAGPFGPETFAFLRDLGCRLKQATGEAKSFSYLRQRLSVAVQLRNAAAVMGTMGGTTSPFDFFS